jgi:aarF domain-containing kinase
MSLARNLVDLYVLTSAVTKVGTTVLSSQSNALCHHVKTSSLLNPVPHIPKSEAAPTEKSQHTVDHVEVPFPIANVEHQPDLKQASEKVVKVEVPIKETSAPITKVTPAQHTKTSEVENTAIQDIKQPIQTSSPIIESPPAAATSQIFEADDDVNTYIKQPTCIFTAYSYIGDCREEKEPKRIAYPNFALQSIMELQHTRHGHGRRRHQ